MPEWFNPLFEERLAQVRAAAEALGYEVLRELRPPYGWNLVDADRTVLDSGPLERLERYMNAITERRRR